MPQPCYCLILPWWLFFPLYPVFTCLAKSSSSQICPLSKSTAAMLEQHTSSCQLLSLYCRTGARRARSCRLPSCCMFPGRSLFHSFFSFNTAFSINIGNLVSYFMKNIDAMNRELWQALTTEYIHVPASVLTFFPPVLNECKGSCQPLHIDSFPLCHLFRDMVLVILLSLFH